jgi:hypothetical protein
MLGMFFFKKAYDSISQEWIIMVLEHVGFPPRIINYIKAVQAKAASTSNIRGVLSGVIPILSGFSPRTPRNFDKRFFNDELIYLPLRAEGIGLLNIVEQAKSLRATRAARFFRDDTAARQTLCSLPARQ